MFARVPAPLGIAITIVSPLAAAFLAVAPASADTQGSVGAAYAKLCASLPSPTATAALPSDDRIGLTTPLVLYRPKTRGDVDCAMRLATLLSARGDAKLDAADGSADDGTADRTRSDRIVWDLVEEATFDDRIDSSIRSYITLQLAIARDHAASIRLAQTARLARLSLPKPDENISTFKASDFERIIRSATGYSFADFLTTGMATLATPPSTSNDGAALDTQMSRVEIKALEDLDVTIFEQAIAKAADGTFFNASVPAWSNLQSATLLKLQIIETLRNAPLSVRRRVILDWLARTKAMRFDAQVSPPSPFPVVAIFDVNASAYTGRCNAQDYTVSNLVILEDKTIGQGCKYDDHPEHNGNAVIRFTQLGLYPAYGGLGVTLHAGVGSQLFGGHRDNTFLGPSDEEETASVNYTVHGVAKIPPCNDVGFCNSLVDLLVVDSSVLGTNAGNDGSATYAASYVGPDSNEVVLPVNRHVLVDRSVGLVTLNLKLSRSDRHVGTGPAKPALVQNISLIATTAPAPFAAFSMSTLVDGILYYIQRPDMRYYVAPGNARYTIGQIVAFEDPQLRAPRDSEERFSNAYLRLFLEDVLEHSDPSLLDSFDQQSLRAANRSLSAAWLRNFRPAIKADYDGTSQAFSIMSFPTVIQSLSDIIDRLIATDGGSTDSLSYLNNLGNQMTPIAGTPINTNNGVTQAITQAKDAANQGTTADLVDRLLELRTRLWLSEQQMAAKVGALGIEVSLYQSS